MEIVVKTAAEFRDAHVTIEIRADQAEVPEISRRLTGSEAANVLDQAERAGKVPALERRIRELEADRSGSRGRIGGLEDRVRDLVAERDALLLKGETDRAADHDLVIAARAERDAEKQRADENREWAERIEAHLEARTRARDKATEKLTRIQDKVWKDTLDHAMNHRGDPVLIPVETVGDLANIVSAVRAIVGQP